uniref:CAPA receptor variant A n=1 Tax=Rhodnius prolixus TaxID=13249 RepID=D6P3E5_RHOPR|nr:CAPA receptor variant A [Rhodnius prolixus]
MNSFDIIETVTNSTPVNVSLEEYLIIVRGPKFLPLKILLPITFTYGILFISGLFGNLAVCIVIAYNKSMHNATNYYLFSLAMSDLVLLLLGLPNDLSVFWQQYPWILGLLVCKLRALVSEMSSYVSVLTIVAFSVERYTAICYPLKSYTTDKLNRVIKVIGTLWLISLGFAAPFAIYTTIDYVDFPPGSGKAVIESAFCAMLKQNVPADVPLYELSCTLFFICPAVILIFLYVRIGLTIKNNTKLRGNVHGELQSIQSKKSIVSMLMAVVVAFFICWAPFHMQRLIYVYMSDYPWYGIVNVWLYYISGIFYYFSATINPILYNLMSLKYRKAFKQTLWCRKYNRIIKTPGLRETNSTSRQVNKSIKSMNMQHNQSLLANNIEDIT